MKQLIKNTLTHLAAGFGQHRYSSASPHLWVLMYHRILPTDDERYALEEPGMIVTPETFRQHLQILKSLFEVMPLSEWLARRRQGLTLPARACAITFDDGWLDNYQFAFPILQEQNTPATLFAVSHMIGTRRQFWPNRLARVLSLKNSAFLPGLDDLPCISSATSLTREWLAQIIVQLKQLSDAELDDRLKKAEDSLNLSPEPAPALMDWSHVREMQNSGLIEIGSHTCNHFRLQASLPKEILAREIRDSARMIEEQTGQPASLFCYPNGDTCADAVELVGKQYQGAVTTRRGINNSATPATELLRIGIHEDIGNTPTQFEARLSGWL